MLNNYIVLCSGQSNLCFRNVFRVDDGDGDNRLVMAVIVTNIYAKTESPERAPDWCIAIVSRFYPDYFPANVDNTGSRLAKANRKRKCYGFPTTCSGQLQWTFPITSTTATSKNSTAGDKAIEKPEVVIESRNEITQHADDASGDRNGKDASLEMIRSEDRCKCGNSDTGDDNKPKVDDVVTDQKRLRDKRDRQRAELEWKLVAMFTDRVFFWLFLVLSIIVHIVLLLQFRQMN